MFFVVVVVVVVVVVGLLYLCAGSEKLWVLVGIFGEAL